MQIRTHLGTKKKDLARPAYSLFFVLAFLGPALGGIALGPINMYPARIFALATWVLLPFTTTKNPGKYLLFPALWLAWAALSLTWTIDLGQGLRSIFNLCIGLSLFGLAPLFLDTEKRIDWAAKIWLGAFFALLGLGLFEHMTSVHLPISRFSHGIQPHLAYRPTGVFVNENNYAAFLSLSFPFLLARWRHFPNLWSRITAGLGLFVGVYLLFVTGSRINYFVLGLTTLIYSLFLTPKRQKLRVLVTLTLFVLGTWLFFGLSQPIVRGSMANQFRDVWDSYLELRAGVGDEYLVSSNSIAVRINMVRNGAALLLQTWGRGVGAGNFQAWVSASSTWDTKGFVNPHNWWVELAAEFGVLITLGYLFTYLGLLWSAWQGWRRGIMTWIPEALCLALSIFPLVAVSPSSLLGYLPHWLLLALALAWQQRKGVSVCES